MYTGTLLVQNGVFHSLEDVSAEAQLKPIKYYLCLSQQPFLASKSQFLINSWLEQWGLHQQLAQILFPPEKRCEDSAPGSSSNNPSTLQGPKLCWEAQPLGRPAGG